MNTATKPVIKKIPNWASYFSPKERKVIYRVEFYSHNSKRTAYASYKTYQKDCGCSESTVYRALRKAEDLGVVLITTQSSSYTCPKSGVKYFQKNLKVQWLGDCEQTKGDLIFLPFEGKTEGKIEGFYKKNMNSSKEEGKGSQDTLNRVEKEVKEELKEYKKGDVEELINELKQKYTFKPWFLNRNKFKDLDNTLNAFKSTHSKKTIWYPCSNNCGSMSLKKGTPCSVCVHYDNREI